MTPICLVVGLAIAGLVPDAALAQTVVYRNTVTYTVPFQPGYGGVVYGNQSSGVSLTITNPSVTHFPGSYYPVYPGYPQPIYPGYPPSTVIVAPNAGRPIRNVKNSVLINPTVINGTIRNSTLINPTIVPAPVAAPNPVVHPSTTQTLTFPPIYQHPPVPSTIVIQTVERR
jgi:hypothetical protein